MAYIDEINAIRDAVFTLLNTAGIKNLRLLPLTVYKRGIPENFAKEDCPAASVYKNEVSGRRIETDQSDVELPINVSLMIVISDYSLVDLDDAEKYTDDLIQKIITKLETNPTLTERVQGIEIARIKFDEDRREGVWFSEPFMEVEVIGKKL